MVLASEDQGHVLVTINITKAPVFAITINGIIISDNNHHHSHQYKQHLPHCPIHPLIIINASLCNFQHHHDHTHVLHPSHHHYCR